MDSCRDNWRTRTEIYFCAAICRINVNFILSVPSLQLWTGGSFSRNYFSNVWNVLYCFPILTKIGMCLHIRVKLCNIALQEKQPSSSVSCAEGRTGRLRDKQTDSVGNVITFLNSLRFKSPASHVSIAMCSGLCIVTVLLLLSDHRIQYPDFRLYC